MELGEMRNRVLMALDMYSENGVIVSPDDSKIADVNNKIIDAVNIVQRKLAVSMKKKTAKMSLTFKKPSLLESVISDSGKLNIYRLPLTVNEAECVFFKLPRGARTMSISAYCEYNHLEFNGNMDFIGCFHDCDSPDESCDVIKTKDYKIITKNGKCNVKLFIDEIYHLYDALFLKISAPKTNSLEIYNASVYKNGFPSYSTIPEHGFVKTKIPPDIMNIVKTQKISGEELLTVPDNSIDYDFSTQTASVSLNDSGEYYVTYEKYPAAVDYNTPDDFVFEFDDYICDALVFGVASVVCPSEKQSVISKMNYLYGEAVKNIYATQVGMKKLGNKVFQSAKRLMN